MKRRMKDDLAPAPSVTSLVLILHPSSFILHPHPSSFSKWRNVVLGTLLVLTGLGAAAITLIARRTNDNTLATVGAILSLIIAGLIIILIVPPLARSARLEVAGLDLPAEVTTGGGIFLAIVRRCGICRVEYRSQSALSDFFFACLHTLCRLARRENFITRSNCLGAFSRSYFCRGSGAGNCDVCETLNVSCLHSQFWLRRAARRTPTTEATRSGEKTSPKANSGLLHLHSSSSGRRATRRAGLQQTRSCLH